jgi:hypothetical protein
MATRVLRLVWKISVTDKVRHCEEQSNLTQASLRGTKQSGFSCTTSLRGTKQSRLSYTPSLRGTKQSSP